MKSVRHADGRWHVVKANGEILMADALCIALPSYAAADLLRPVDTDLAAELDSALGTAWDEALEAYRDGGDGADVSWLSRGVG